MLSNETIAYPLFVFECQFLRHGCGNQRYSHRHYDSDAILFAKFTKETGIKVNAIKGSADQLIQRLISEGKNSPAERFLLTVDAGRLHRAKEAGILQPVQSEKLQENAPLAMRDPEGNWYGLTVRARVLVYAKGRVKPSELSTYEDLASSKWRARLTVRSSSNIYNQSLLASIIEANGAEKALDWAKAVRKNMVQARAGATVTRLERWPPAWPTWPS